MTDPLDSEEERDDMLAAEYVLGLLGRTERGTVADRMTRDVTMLRRVAHWEERLSGMNDGFVSEIPPRRIQATIEKRLFAEEHARQPLMARLWVWKALATFAVALLMLSVFYPKTGNDEILVAALSKEDDSRQFVALLEDSGRVRIVQVAGGPEAEKSYELWLIEDGADPLSLGILGATGLPQDFSRPVPAGATLAITVEQLGGSPDGTPKGPVVALGTLENI